MERDIPSQLSLFKKKFEISKKQPIYKTGEAARGIYYVSKGLVGLYQLTEGGKESLLRIYGPNSYFGYRSLFTHQTYPSTARAMLPSTITKLNIDSFNTLLELDSALAHSLMQEVCHELGQAETRLVDFNNCNAKRRINKTLHYFFCTYPNYPWTYREISEYSGTDITTTIRHCATLKASNILDKTSRKPKLSKQEQLINLLS